MGLAAEVQCERMQKGPGKGALCISQSFRGPPLPSLHLTWSFEKQIFNYAWQVPGTKHLEKKMEPVPGDLVTPSVCQRTGGGQPGSIIPASLNEQSCS